MAAAWTYDTTNKLFVIDAAALDVNGEITIDAVEAYSQVKIDWLNNDELNKFRFPLNSIGGQPIGGGNFISAYIQLKSPWKIQPPAANASITIVGNVITEDGSDPFVDNPGMYHHVVKYVVSANSFSISQEELVNQVQDLDNEIDLLVNTQIPNLPNEMWTLADGIETNLTPQQAMRIFAAVIAGKAVVNGTNITFRDIGDTKDVVNADFTEFGDRTNVTHTP